MMIAVEEWELYNNGILLCKWFDTEKDSIETIEKYVAKVKTEYLMKSDDIEMFIADVEGKTVGLISGNGSVEEAYMVSEQIKGLDNNDITAVSLMLEAGIITDIHEAIIRIDDMVSTGETSMEDVAFNYINDCGLIGTMPSSLQCYFDYKSLGRDMEINGIYMTDEDNFIWEYIA